MAGVVNATAAPFMSAPPAEEGAAGVVAQGLGGVLGVVGAPQMILDTGFASLTAPIAALFPAMPAITLLGLHVGIPHAHMHPPSFIPPAPPIPLPSIGLLVGSGAINVLIGGMPAARAGDIGIAVTCGSLAPPFEVFTGSSNVFIGGARAARILDLTKHCNPTSMGPLAKAMSVAGIAAGAASAIATDNSWAAAQAAADAAVLALQLLCGKDPGIPPGTGMLVGPPVPNVLIGGFPCPPIGAMALGGLMRALKKAGKVFGKRSSKGANGHCANGSHPIYLVTGENFDSFVDFVSGGLFQWRRHCTSARARTDGVLGHGFRHFYQRELRLRLHRATFVDWDGVEIEFPRFERESNMSRSEGYVLRKLAPGHYELARRGQPTLEFVGGEFDGSLQLTRLTSPGNALVFEYNTLGRLAQAIEYSQRTQTRRIYQFHYDTHGHLAGVVEVPDSNAPDPVHEPVVRARYGYDNANNLVRVRDAGGGTWAYEYDAFHRITRQTDARGYSYLFRYDSHGRCVAASGQDGLWWAKVEYFPDKFLTRYTEGDNAKWEFHYDSNGVVRKIVDPYGGMKCRELDGEGRLAVEIDSGGRETRWLYDSDGAHYARIDRFGNLFPPEIELPKPPNPFARALPSTALGWLFAGGVAPAPRAMFGAGTELLSRIPPQVLAQAQRCFRWREPGSADSRSSSLLSPQVERDVMGRKTREVDAMGRTRQWAYDPTGNLVAMRDRDGRVTSQETTSWNLVGERRDSLGNVVRYGYSRLEQITSLTDPLGNKTQYDYDLKERLVRVYDNGRLLEEYIYDLGDHFIEKRDGSAAVVFKNEIHENHFVAVRHLASGGQHQFDYDERGRIIEASTEKHEVHLGYDREGLLVRDLRDGKGLARNLADGTSITKILDRFNLKSTRTPSGAIELVDSAGKKTTLTHDSSGVVERRCSNGTTELLQFDDEGRLEARLVHKADRVALRVGWSVRYTYTEHGDLIEVADSARGTTRYEMDGAHRLVGRLTPSNERYLYSYDAAGNITSKPGMGQVDIGLGNRLSASLVEAFEYDDCARLAARYQQDGSVVRYTYDSFDMLLRVERTEPNGAVQFSWEAEYDALGRRVLCRWRSDDAQEYQREFYWERDRLAAEIFPNGRFRVYQYATRESLVPLSFIEYTSLGADPASGRSYDVFCDQAGMPLSIESGKGQVVWWASSIDPYGVVEIRPGSEVEYNLRWPGHYYDIATGLQYNRYRYYDPVLGRYLQSDPIGHRGSPVNLYAYCANPLVQVDVLGLTHSERTEGAPGANERGEAPNGKKGPGDAEARSGNRRLTSEELSQAKAAMQRSVDTHKELPRQYQTKTVASDGKKTLSGFDPPGRERVTPVPEGFERRHGVNDAQTMIDHSKAIGHEPVRSGASDHGLDGASSATHAEKQLARVHAADGTDAPIGVNREQCGDCRQWFRQEAQDSGQTKTVADPQYTRAYQPDGSVDVYNTQTGQYVSTAGPNEQPTASLTRYTGIPW
jgi:RHS repeat-associated protein